MNKDIEQPRPVIDPTVERYIRLWKERPPDTRPDWYVWTGGWYEEDGENNYYCEWPMLTEDSIVFEAGGYEGAWAKRIADAYDPTIHSFEPAPRAHKMAVEKLAGYPKVHLHLYGLGATNETLPLGDSDRDGASFLKPDEDPFVMAQKRCFAEVVQELGVTHIDLMAINIEGGEFELIPHITQTGLIHSIERLMIQWHAPGREDIDIQMGVQERIAETHEMIWNLGAWEAWERKHDD